MPDYRCCTPNTPALNIGTLRSPDFVRFYEDSGILRARKGHYNYTVMREKQFPLFPKRNQQAGDEGGRKFCEHRAFKAETMEILPGGTGPSPSDHEGLVFAILEEAGNQRLVEDGSGARGRRSWDRIWRSMCMWSPRRAA